MSGWTLPDPNGKYNFYDQKNAFIYYTRENPDTSYDDLGCYDVLQYKNYIVLNAHMGKVTGIAHFSPNILISTSMIG